MILLCANETTELLKPLLAGPRDPVGGRRLSDASWPSGHATAAMSLCLCWVIAAPARLRPAVAAVMAAFAVAVSYSFLELGWHYPSDVLGGFLIAAVWTLLGIAALSLYEQRQTVRRSPSCRSGSRWPRRWARRPCWPSARSAACRGDRRSRARTQVDRLCAAPHLVRGRSGRDRSARVLAGVRPDADAARFRGAVVAVARGDLRPAASAVAAGLPERLVAAVRAPAEDEQQVRQPVEVAHDSGLQSSPQAIAARSARRQTVRQMCSAAADGVPPGSTNERSGSSVALTSSQRCSSHAVCSGITRSRSRSEVGSSGDGDVGADVEQVVLDAGQPSRYVAGRPSSVSVHPSCALSSSTVP